MSQQDSATAGTPADRASGNQTSRPPSPPQHAAPAGPRFGPAQTERPIEPSNPYRPMLPKETDAPIGNQKAILELKLEGRLGDFYDRNRTTRIPTHVEIDLANFRQAVYICLFSVLDQSIRTKMSLDNPTQQINAASVATDLTNGVMVMLYLKLRTVNYNDDRVEDNFRFKPKVPDPFRIPMPYAFAISQLGKVKISGMQDEIYLTPSAPAGIDTTFGCPAERPWSPVAYSQAVELAKNLGMRFETVDLKVKMGSTWWLYRPVEIENSVDLVCPYAEMNFTVNTAVLATLFCCTPDGGILNPIVNLETLGDLSYGTMARRIEAGLALNVYYAIEETKDLDYDVVN